MSNLVEVCPIQLPGRENRIFDAHIGNVAEIAELVCRGIGHLLEMDFALFGYSLGAILAYETAQCAERAGHQPRRLIVAAHRAPQCPFPGNPTWNLPEGEFKRRLQDLNGTPDEILADDELFQLVVPTLRADFRLDETYLLPPDHALLNCPITVLAGQQDAEVPMSSLHPWSEMTKNKFEIRLLEGDHFLIRKRPQALVRALNKALSQPDQ